jgi:hypothetical protein
VEFWSVVRDLQLNICCYLGHINFNVGIMGMEKWKNICGICGIIFKNETKKSDALIVHTQLQLKILSRLRIRTSTHREWHG